MLFSLAFLCASLAAASILKGPHAHLQKRDDTVCTDLSVSTNNGDRKVAIVMDSSGSMAYNDPYDLRIKAGRALNEFLIASGEARGGQKIDQVTIIDFDDDAHLDYPLGDPGGANSSFENVDATGGTYIASGVNMAIAQLTRGGGGTDKRSAIVVFTDGEDYNPDELVDAINNATAAGIRVSFGFLDTSASSQPPAVLSAVKDSRGVYATITVAAGSQNFINYVLLNGLTYNDNPQGYDSQLLAGLAETHFVSGSDTVTLKYAAQQGERVNFTVTSISAGFLGISAVMGGKELNTTNTTYSYSVIDVTAPSSGELDLKITAKAAPKDSMFSVITNSNTPFKNCTVGVTGGGGGGLSAGGKAGVGIGVAAVLLGLGGLGGYFAYKHFIGGGGGGGGGGNAVPPSGGESNTVQYVGDTGGEKIMAHTNVYPIDSMSHGLPPGDGGQGVMAQGPPGRAVPMSGPPGPQSLASPLQGMQGAVPPTTSPLGAPPPSGLPLTAGPPTSAVPLTGVRAISGSVPMAFIPPLVPPNALNTNNAAPKEKGPGGTQGQSGAAPQQVDSHYQTLKDIHPGNFAQQMAPGQQPMGPNGAQPMSAGSPASQGFSGPAGSGAYPPAPQSQAPFAYGSDVHTMAPGTSPGLEGPGGPPAPASQMLFGQGAEVNMQAVSPNSSNIMSPGGSQPLSPSPMGSGGPSPGFGSQLTFGHGGEPTCSGSHAPGGTGGYPPAPGSQAAPNPQSQFWPGTDSYHHGSGSDAYQGPLGHGSPGQIIPMSGADGYTQTIGGPGGQHAVPNPLVSDPNFNHTSGQPMTGIDDANHTLQSHINPNSYHQNGTMSDSYHQSGQPVHPGSHHQHGSAPSPQGTSLPLSTPSSTAPISNPMTPQGNILGPLADMYHHYHPPPDPSSQANPSGTDASHQSLDCTEYHDPDSCSCSEGYGPDSDAEGRGATPTPGNAADPNNPGVYVPGAPFRSADKKKKKKSGAPGPGRGREA